MRRSHNPMFLFRICAATLTLCMFALVGSANANLVTITDDDVTLADSADQTEDGQKFTFTFSDVPHSDGTKGTLKIHVRGDFTLTDGDEYLDWSVEGVASGTAFPGTPADPIVDQSKVHNVEWYEVFTISGADMIDITADNQVKITVDYSDAVSKHSFYNEFASVELTYVPEPATLFLLGAGSLLFLRRRRHKA